MHANLFSFAAGSEGIWRIDRILPVAGETLPTAARLDIASGHMASASGSLWALNGFTSNSRYTKRAELDALGARQAPLGRAGAKCAALIPIRKTAAWWAMAQDERREIMEEQSRHIAIGMDYLPAIARRLHHSRDLGEPFDFLTWFEFAPEHEASFDEMLRRLRDTAEGGYVDREVDVRLVFDS